MSVEERLAAALVKTIRNFYSSDYVGWDDAEAEGDVKAYAGAFLIRALADSGVVLVDRAVGDRHERLEEVATELCDAVSAYFDPENQYTESRQHAVLVAKKMTRNALAALQEPA